MFLLATNGWPLLWPNIKLIQQIVKLCKRNQFSKLDVTVVGFIEFIYCVGGG